MGWLKIMGNNIRRGIRSWLDTQPEHYYSINIKNEIDWELGAIRNRIWYRGDSSELQQLYNQLQTEADKYKFWSATSTPGMEIRKIHTGLPGLIIKTLTSIVMEDLNDFELPDEHKFLWSEIESENDFRVTLEKAIKDILCIGDGAFKITIDTNFSDYPILEWYPGDRVEIVKERGRLKEVIFKTIYKDKLKNYTLYEIYGYGYVKHELYKGEDKVDLSVLESTKNLKDWQFDNKLILGTPLKVYESTKWENRGGSVFDGKLDSFDSFDEVWSQWMDALRAGRAKVYIPEDLVPKDPWTGQDLKSNPFDSRFFKIGMDGKEGAVNKIEVDQPIIPHDSYLASYCTALDQCLQGIISPSTLGVDVKKLDNAEAQREKEKATLYTRNLIIEALQKELPKVVNASINAFNVLNKKECVQIKVNIPFGEYANPSFESQVETISKARPGSAIMSIEAQVEEMWGDSKDKAWKEEEVARLKSEQGIADISETSVGQSVETNPEISLLNGAQITSLMNIIRMVKDGSISRREAISIIVSTLGISRESAESFVEEETGNASKDSEQII